MHLEIPRLYDSHAHFIATGEFSSGLRLENIHNLEDLKKIDLGNTFFYRKNFIVGFGWDLKKWQNPILPTKKELDLVFGEVPVCFARIDGHSCWMNTAALRILNIQSESGILTEKDHLRAWDQLPSYSEEQVQSQIVAAATTFNKAGFTHVRDMSCTEELWNSLIKVADRGDLTVALEENFTSHDRSDFDQTLKLAAYTNKHQHTLVRSKGVKVFYDGSLGSETAYLSRNYLNSESHGRVLWPLAEIQEMLKLTWEQGLEFSVHVIGDQAAHEIVQAAREVSAKGAVGRLNLEHAQLLRPETIKMMKPLHVRCHMQPCHWLSDKEWLSSKIGDLTQYLFPWGALEAMNIPVSFGCDSPVEPTSFARNLEALELSQLAGIKALRSDISILHAHPDKTFAPSLSRFKDGKLKEINFNGRKLEI